MHVVQMRQNPEMKLIIPAPKAAKLEKAPAPGAGLFYGVALRGCFWAQAIQERL
jgi:hypothetical protein